jgi:ketosteroid isomerase-like protein
MKRAHILIFVAILAGSQALFGQAVGKRGADVIEQLKQFDHDWLDAEKRDDVAYCEKYFADSYVLVVTGGKMYTKSEWLGVLKSPDHPVIESIDPEDIQVHLHGNMAILIDRTTLKGHDSKGKEFGGQYKVFRVVIKQGGEWRATGVVMNPIEP